MQFIVNILVLASIYALIACGYVLIYRVSRVLNLAHGELMMLGAYGLLFLFAMCLLFAQRCRQPIKARSPALLAVSSLGGLIVACMDAYKTAGLRIEPLLALDARFTRGASVGMTMCAGTPRVRAAMATAWAWLPLECVTTAAASSLSARMALCAPRALNAPPRWRFSHLKKSRLPARRSRVPQVITGVRWTCGAMRSRAASMLLRSAAYSVTARA